jgi:hypothetical protein
MTESVMAGHLGWLRQEAVRHRGGPRVCVGDRAARAAPSGVAKAAEGPQYDACCRRDKERECENGPSRQATCPLGGGGVIAREVVGAAPTAVTKRLRRVSRSRLSAFSGGVPRLRSPRVRPCRTRPSQRLPQCLSQPCLRSRRIRPCRDAGSPVGGSSPNQNNRGGPQQAVPLSHPHQAQSGVTTPARPSPAPRRIVTSGAGRLDRRNRLRACVGRFRPHRSREQQRGRMHCSEARSSRSALASILTQNIADSEEVLDDVAAQDGAFNTCM